MAYYSPNFCNADLGEYELTPCDGNYDFAPTQALMAYSGYEFSEPKFIEYDQTPYYGAYDYDPALTRSAVAYSTSTYSEPKLFHYDPRYGSQTQFIISYSTLDHNEPEFIVDNPTPFIGGYDITQTYGKPLPPSDEICYPRSARDPDPGSLDGFSNGSLGSVVLPFGKEEIDEDKEKPQNGIEPTRGYEPEQPPAHDGGQDLVNHEPGNLNQGEEREGTFDDYYPWSGYDGGFGNGRSEDYGYEYEKQLPQTPCGYGSDAMDLCESIFGYWPCLSRRDWKSHGCQEAADEESNRDHWKGTTDFIFGSSYGYGDRRDESSYGDPIYGYEKHYQEPDQYRQVEYDEHSWL